MSGWKRTPPFAAFHGPGSGADAGGCCVNGFAPLPEADCGGSFRRDRSIEVNPWGEGGLYEKLDEPFTLRET